MTTKRIEAFNAETGQRNVILTSSAALFAEFINRHRDPPWVLLAEYRPGVDRNPMTEWNGTEPIFERIKALESKAGITPKPTDPLYGRLNALESK